VLGTQAGNIGRGHKTLKETLFGQSVKRGIKYESRYISREALNI
jgi:hypothetical protein